jgi:outer membrane protein OmpA-like peptidoglycan-associated protein
MPSLYLKHLLFFVLLWVTSSMLSQNNAYKYSLSQKIIASDFLNAPNRNSKITSLPRGIELCLRKYNSPNSFFSIPIRVGFSRASSLDTFTTGKAFYGLDFQYGRIIFKNRFSPFIASGLGFQQLNKQRDIILPIYAGFEIPIDSTFVLSLQAGYRHAFKQENTVLQYGLGISFNMGKLKRVRPIFHPVSSPVTVPEITQDALIAQSRPPQEIVDELSLIKPSPIFQVSRLNNFQKEWVNLGINKPQVAITPNVGQETTRNFGIEPLNELHFKTNSSQLTSASIKALEASAQRLLAQSYSSVIIEGHTDNVGSEEYNFKLSLQRADVCKDYLIKFGLDPQKITTRGLGESHPKADNNTEKGRASNRRVEVYVIFN